MKHKIYKISGACYSSLGQLDAAVKSYKKVIAGLRGKYLFCRHLEDFLQANHK